MTSLTRYYKIDWYETKDIKYGGEPNMRTTQVTLSKPTGLTEVDSKNALAIFMSNNGNLKKNTVTRIREYDNLGQIGKDITPSDETNAVIPEVRR